MTLPPLSVLWDKLKDAPAFRVGTIYAGASWFLIEAADTFGMESGLIRRLALVLAAGFLVAVPAVWLMARSRHEGKAPQQAPAEGSGRTRAGRRRWGYAVAALLVIASGLWGMRMRVAARGPVPEAAERLAVLPFHATGSAEIREFGTGMVDLLTAALSDVGGISTVPSRTVLAAVRESGGDDGMLALDGALEVGRSLGAGSVLTGTATAFGETVRLTGEIRAVTGGVVLASAEEQGARDSVMTLTDRLAIGLLRELWRSRAPLPTVRISALTTTSPTALRAHLRGEEHLRALRMDSAAFYFRRAVEVDSTFALAWLRLADATGWDDAAAEGIEARRGFAAKALALSDRLPDRERAYVRSSNLALNGDFAAFDSLDAYVRRHPDDPMGWYALGDTRFHSNYLGRFEDADIIGPFLESTRLDPALAVGLHHVLDMTIAAGDRATFDTAFARYARVAPPHRIEAFQQQANIRWAPADSVMAAFVRAVRGRHPIQDRVILNGAVGALGRKARLDLKVDPIVYPNALDSLARMVGSDRYWRERTRLLRFLAWEAYGRPDSADAAFERWLAQNPQNRPPVSPVLFRALLKVWQATDGERPLDDGAEPARMLEDSVGASDMIPSALHMFYLARGEPAAAARFSAAAPEPPPDMLVDRDALAQGWRGWLLLAGGETAPGVAAIDSSIQRLGYADANQVGIPWGRYAIAIADDPERRPQAIRMLRQQTTTVITNVGEHFLALARALEAEGDRAAARDAYAHVLRLWANAAEFRQPALDEARRALERLAVEPR